MPHEESFVQKASSEEEFQERAKQTIELLGEIPSEDVICMAGVVVTRDKESDEAKVQVFVLGSDDDIAKMLTTLVTVTRDGVIKANTPSNPDNEVTH